MSSPDQALDAIDAQLDLPPTRLAAYGTLRPGESNHHLLDDVGGVWQDGTVEGERFIANGYPAFKWRPGGAPIAVSVLTSPVLPLHWARLDAFEGPNYRRLLVPVCLSSGTWLVAYVYEYIPT